MITPLEFAHRFVGEIKELQGSVHHPFVQWCHMLAGLGPDQPDETAWCGSFMTAMAWVAKRTPPASPARARSWLTLPHELGIEELEPGFDICIFKRGSGAQPGPDVLDAPGHVALFVARQQPSHVLALGGNQNNGVTIEKFPLSRVLGFRRL